MGWSWGSYIRSRRWVEAALARLGWFTGIGVIVTLVTLVGFVLVADAVMAGVTRQIDLAVLSTLRAQATPGWDRFASIFTMLGAEGLVVLIVVALVLLLLKRHWGDAVLLAVGAGGAEILNSVIKLFFHRARPTSLVTTLPGQVYSFPSGHAMMSLVTYGLFAAILWPYLRPRFRGVLIALLLVLVGAIGFSRIYLGLHYLSDVIGSYLAGAVWLVVMLMGSRELRRVAARLRGDHASPTSSDDGSDVSMNGHHVAATKRQQPGGE